MTPDEFDLDDPPGEDESPAQRRRRERRSSQTKSKDAGKSSGSSGPTEGQLSGRLNEAFSKLANQLAAKGDDELADAIADEKSGMTNGLMSLTRSVTFLRSPLVYLVEAALVVLAFWRVGRILFVRFVNWRQRVMTERAQYAEQYDGEGPPQGGPIIPEGAVIAN